MPSDLSSEEAELLPKFVALLGSKEPISLPRQTVLGAISHYISTRSASELQPLLETISNSPYLWASVENRPSTAEAIKLGVTGAVDRLRAQPGSSRWWKRRDVASVWLDQLCQHVTDLEGDNRLSILVAILAGCEPGRAGHQSRRWTGKERDNLEDEIVMELSEALRSHDSTGKEVDMSLLCQAMELLDGDRLLVLDTQAIQVRLYSHLDTSLLTSTSLSPSKHMTPPSTLSRALARLLSICNDGDEDQRQRAWNMMRQLGPRMRDILARLPNLAPITAQASKTNQNEVFDQHKTALFSVLVPSATILSILLSSDPPISVEPDTSSSPPKLVIATEILQTLSAFAAVLDQSEGGLEGYHTILHGMTDILVSSGGSVGVRNILGRAPNPELCTPAEGSWWMTFGESVIRQVDRGSLETVLEPMTRRFIADNTHRSRFEAAHSLRLAIIQAASENLPSESLARAQFQKDLSGYSDLLIKQYSESKLTNDPFRSAYPLAIEAASKHSDDLVNACLTQLRMAKAPTSSPEIFGQTRRLVLIASAPHIASNRLRPYLNSLAQEIVATPPSSNLRIELTGAAFRMIMHDLGDSVRMEGMGWWTEWREVFEQASVGRGEAKL